MYANKNEYVYILGGSPLSNMWFANIFSEDVVCLYILLTRAFTEQKVLILIRYASW
jgi:hypothetical protein